MRFDMNMSNFDMLSLKKLENINPNDEKKILEVLQEVIANGVSLNIPHFSVKSIEYAKQKMNGFVLKSGINIDKSLNLSLLNQNPLSAMNAMEAFLYLEIPNEMFQVIAQTPEAMMSLLLFPPKDMNGTKVYDVELKKSKLMVNGVPMM
jgi:hypothetical protein